MKPAILMGGGLESSLLYRHLVRIGIQPVPIWIEYGQLAAHAEYYAVCKIVAPEKPTMLMAPYIKGMNPGGSLLFGTSDHPEVQGRNLYFIMEAMKKFDEVYVGAFDRHDWLPDAGPSFFSHVNSILALCFKGRKKVLTPLMDMSVKDMVSEELKRDPKFLNTIFSCWTPVNDEPCGKCKHCKKIESLHEAFLRGL